MTTESGYAQPKGHRLRLLLPFFFQRAAVAAAAQRLGGLTHETIKRVNEKEEKKTWPCWMAGEAIPQFYRDETLRNVRDFLFGVGDGPGGCGYLRVPDATANTWFKRGGSFEPAAGSAGPKAGDRPAAFKVHLAAPGIELFLSPHGAGVLSVAFEPPDGLDLTVLQDLNYRLSQGRRFTAWRFRTPHGDPNRTPPADDVPLVQRLGYSGGAFHLIEWAGFLLEPLADLGYQSMQDQFSVYCVTRFGPAADFTDPTVSASLRPFLNALAHVEEPGHAGSLTVAQQVLNPRHWAAVGSLGAAHLVADQDPPRSYDEQRLPSVLHKYFIPYLVSLLQRAALQRLLGEARAALAAAGDEAPRAGQPVPVADLPQRLRGLNGQALAFTVNGCFTEVSSREVINQYYDLVQTGLRVADGLGTLQRALRDAEAMDNDRYQGTALDELGTLARDLKKLLDEAANSARLVAHVQSKVEWLEVFFVSYYFTALMYYVNHGDSLFSPDYSFWSLVLAPAVSGAIAFFGLKPHKLRGQTEHPTGTPPGGDSPAPDKGHTGHAWGFLVWLIAVFILWLVVGFNRFPAEPGSGHQAAHAPTAVVSGKGAAPGGAGIGVGEKH
ncbi:hypothetical protein [uncultured Thiodictyon sp.]|uniref:hypothetical protein n=1 Tax=uncultured Thiodictyon sp. TaxID=1846217 RepID=UPI0025E30B5D|nr:hypothetical protein [uncultured Thiodictyon sp.]